MELLVWLLFLVQAVHFNRTEIVAHPGRHPELGVLTEPINGAVGRRMGGVLEADLLHDETLNFSFVIPIEDGAHAASWGVTLAGA